MNGSTDMLASLIDALRDLGKNSTALKEELLKPSKLCPEIRLMAIIAAACMKKDLNHPKIIRCHRCGERFPSGNKLHKHLENNPTHSS
jgi:hypothetical protein